MNDRPTPEVDAFFRPDMQDYPAARFARKLSRERDEVRDQLLRICNEGFGGSDTKSLETCADYVLRMLKKERDLMRELMDTLENCREDSVSLLGEWEWKRGKPETVAEKEYLTVRENIEDADALLAKVMEVLG